MLFAGAGGLAAQLFEDLVAMNLQDVVFWSETEVKNTFISDKFNIIKTDEEVKDYFNNVSKAFVLCVGDVENRKKVVERFTNLGGKITSFITPFAYISPYGVTIGNGSMVLNKASLEPGATIGEQCLINRRSNYGHDCVVSSYCEIGPTAIISAGAHIGEGCLIGIGAIILPNIRIGNNVIVQAGAVVTKNIPDNAVVSGVPAIIRFYRKK
ncbi:MAG: NeuD/PglB/VioB family sugar acetyltransferase [Chitinophagaceae bacterium]